MNDYLPFFCNKLPKHNLNQLNPAVLSLVGDAVQTLFVRTELVFESLNPNLLHKKASEQIKASAQADAARKILPNLNEEEEAVFKRCRNHKSSTGAKNATITEYRIASGLEGLIGWLYMAGEHERLLDLLKIGYKS